MAQEILIPHPEAQDLAARAVRHEIPHQGGVVAWRLWGQGKPLLLLHGSHGGWMHWLRNIAALARDHLVIVPDMPGFGESDPPADIESAADHAALLAEGLRSLPGIAGPVDLVGFSLGAVIGVNMALLAPDLVSRLVLVDAGGLGTAFIPADLRSPKGLEGEALRAVNGHNLGAMMLHDPAAIDECAIDMMLAYGPRARSRVQHYVVPDYLLQAARQASVPIDLIWGEHDAVHPDPAANAAVVRAFQPECELRVIADAGHWPMYEQPERFEAALRELLARPVCARIDQALA